jgi:hypothetical protein
MQMSLIKGRIFGRQALQTVIGMPRVRPLCWAWWTYLSDQLSGGRSRRNTGLRPAWARSSDSLSQKENQNRNIRDGNMA